MKKLDNYLRTHRQRTGLSQKEVAQVLGLKADTQVSRHERGARLPTLERALAYGALYRASVKRLFAGVYDRVETATLRRVWLLAVRLGKCPPTAARDWKLKWIRANCPMPGARRNGHGED